jgi:release factor glutamine methyltransferase
VDDLVTRLRAAGCVFAEEEAALLLADGREVDELAARRIAGVPLEHVLGWAEFAGRRYAVDDGVFVPRPRTEALVDLAVELAPHPAHILDLCCGTGAIGLAVLSRTGGSLVGVDLDPAAVANARRNGVPALLGDLDEPLPPAARFDLITLVAPYVPTDEIALLPHEARDFEPPLALDGGDDGLAVVRRAIARSPHRLRPGGLLVTEVSEGQAPLVATLLTDAGLRPTVSGTVVAGQYG